MKAKNLLYSLIALVAIGYASAPVGAQAPDTLWTKTFGGSGNDAASTIQQTTDGGFVLFGSTSSWGAGSWDGWMVKLDNLGDIQWNRQYGIGGLDFGLDGQQTADGSYVLTGNLGTYPVGDAWLVKTDVNGNQIWSRTYNYSSHDHMDAVYQTADGGYIMIGNHDGGLYNIWTIRADANGNMLWNREYWESGNNEGVDVLQTNDGGYIMLCQIHVQSWGYNARIRLIKTDPAGNPIWSRDFGGNNFAAAYDWVSPGNIPANYGRVQQTDDGGYIFTGWIQIAGNTDLWLVKTDPSGNTEWDHTFGGSGGDVGFGLQQTEDGGYIIAGVTNSYGAGNNDVWIIKTDALGNTEWDQTYGGSNYEGGCSVWQTQDGGYIVAGTTNSFGAGGCDAWVLRLGPSVPPIGAIEGHVTPPFDNLTVSLSNSANQFVAAIQTDDGGNFAFDIFTPGSYFVDLVLPAGCEVIQNHIPVTVMLGQTCSVNFTLLVTCAAIAGTVTPVSEIMTVQLSDANNNPLSSVTTDESGNYTFGSLAAGAYYVYLVPPMGYKVDQNHILATAILCQTAIVNFALTPVPISGTVSPAPDVMMVLLWDEMANQIDTAATDQVGYYCFSELDSGTYVVELIAPDGYLVEQNAIQVWLNWGESATVNFTLIPITPTLSGISGTVTQSSLPQSGITMYLFDANRTLLTSTQSAADGSYSFPDLQPGNYMVKVVIPLGYRVYPYEVPVSLSASQMATVDFPMTPTTGVPPQILWTKTFGGSGNDEGLRVIQTNDGGYAIAGHTWSSVPDPDILLIKTDANGNQAWQRTFGWGYSDMCWSVQQTNDGGYAMAGLSDPYGAWGFTQVLLVKTDANGNQVWIRNFGGDAQDDGYCVEQTADGGYIVTGKTSSYGAGGYDVWLIKTDANGNKLWDRTYGGSGWDMGVTVHQTTDLGYIISGYTTSYGAVSNGALLIKTDAAGNETWHKTFGGSGDDKAEAAQQTSDGGYVITGWTPSFGAGSSDFWIIKTDASGNEVWSRTIGGTGTEWCRSCQQTADGGYVLAGASNSLGSGGYDFWVVKTDAYGNEEWNRAIGGASTDHAYSIRQTTEGGFIISGITLSYGAGGEDFYLVRLGELPVTSTISGAVNPAYPNLTVDLFQGSTLLNSVQTDSSGEYTFPDVQPGNCTVELVVPLGFTVNQNNVLITLVAGAAETVNFTLSPIVTVNDARSKGYWKHQMNANITGNGINGTDYTTAQLLGFSQDIFDHFYGNLAHPIQVDSVTFASDSSCRLSMTDMQTMLNINQGGSTKYQRACQQYLTLLLNVVSNKLAQYAPASFDNPPRSVSQAIVYIDQLLTPSPANASANETAKNIAETLNNAQKVAAGVIPSSTPNIIYGEGAQMALRVTEFSFSGPIPNPFNAVAVFRYQLPAAGQVKLQVFDMSGRLVASLIDGWRDAGVYETTFDGSNLSSGVYIYRLAAGDNQASGKMILLK